MMIAAVVRERADACVVRQCISIETHGTVHPAGRTTGTERPASAPPAH
jgi:hypothetical protein